MRRTAVLAPFLAILMALPAAHAGAETVDDRYGSGGGRWKDGSTLIVRARTFDEGGRVGVCGAWTANGTTANTKWLNDDLIATGAVRIGDQTVMRNLRAFRAYKDAGDLAGREAACVTTDTAWEAVFDGVEPTIHIPRRRVRR